MSSVIKPLEPSGNTVYGYATYVLILYHLIHYKNGLPMQLISVPMQARFVKCKNIIGLWNYFYLTYATCKFRSLKKIKNKSWLVICGGGIKFNRFIFAGVKMLRLSRSRMGERAQESSPNTWTNTSYSLKRSPMSWSRCRKVCGLWHCCCCEFDEMMNILHVALPLAVDVFFGSCCDFSRWVEVVFTIVWRVAPIKSACNWYKFM